MLTTPAVPVIGALETPVGTHEDDREGNVRVDTNDNESKTANDDVASLVIRTLVQQLFFLPLSLAVPPMINTTRATQQTRNTEKASVSGPIMKCFSIMSSSQGVKYGSYG